MRRRPAVTAVHGIRLPHAYTHAYAHVYLHSDTRGMRSAWSAGTVSHGSSRSRMRGILCGMLSSVLRAMLRAMLRVGMHKDVCRCVRLLVQACVQIFSDRRHSLPPLPRCFVYAEAACMLHASHAVYL